LTKNIRVFVRLALVTFLSIFLLCGCDADKLNRSAAKINKAVGDFAEEPLKGFSKDSVMPALDNTSKSLSSIKSTKEGLDEVVETYSSAKEKVVETKTAVAKTAKTAKKKVRRVVRRAPRSREEANKRFYAYAKNYFDSMRKKMDNFTKKLQKNKAFKNRQNRPRTR
jgi:hypothetical protein